MNNVSRRLTDLLRDAESRYWESIFLAFILAYTLLLMLTALRYSPNARLFPLLIGVPLIGFIFVRIGILLSDQIDVRSGGMFEEVTAELAKAGENPGTEHDTLMRYRQQVEIVAWIFGLTVLIWAFGFQISLVAFVFAFVAIYEGNLVRALGATSIAYGLVYLLFIQLLSVALYEPPLLPDSIIELLPGFAGTLI